MYSPTIQKLINLFSKFPTIGPRTAARFVFYLLRQPAEETQELLAAIANLKEKIRLCDSCFKSFEPPAEASEGKESELSSSPSAKARESKLCEICRNPRRDKTTICLVEKETDLIPIEKTKKYQGLYFVLGGRVSALKKTDFKKLRTDKLLERIKNSEISEIIIALNPTTEGEATVLYLERKLKPLNIKITRLGRGLPVGGELEYADEETLSSALEGRK
ncbi:MAG TPA: recombination mediator RecR [Patescibacteria group bacterium]|nr:recombination mediator RecR [Patescibacteria group bacterium]